MKKTHKVIDTVYHEDEGNDVFCGTQQECHDWASEQGFGYKVVPMTKEEMKAVNEAYQCNFQLAWIGRCKEEALPDGHKCEKHSKITCVSCGKPATHECPETGQLVCGAPLCDECEHTHAVDGSNGNVGFFRTSELPEGMHTHCKKSEQKAFSWIVISLAEDNPEIRAIVDSFHRGEVTYLEAEEQILAICVKQNDKFRE